MPEPATAPPFTMSKAEVARYLGKSERSVENYVAQDRLPVRYLNTSKGRTAIFDTHDVEHLKRDLETPMVVARPLVNGPDDPSHFMRPEETAVARVPPAISIDEHFARLLQSIVRAREEPPKPWLTLDEAVAFSGLTRAWLLREARDGLGSVVARDMGKHSRGGRWRFHREGLSK
jgi:hypothetical protein